MTVIDLPDTQAMPSITCSCGFSVHGMDEGANADAHARHSCPNDNLGFWDHVFSMDGFWALVLIYAVVVAALGRRLW